MVNIGRLTRSWEVLKVELSSRALLRIGLQVLGVITIINGLCNVIAFGGILPSSEGMMPLAAQVFNIMIPVVTLAAGIFLLVGTKKLAAYLYPDDEEKLDSAKSIFNLSMKILGMVLVVRALPDAVQIISHIIYMKSLSPAISSEVQQQFIFTRLASTLLYSAFGWYLVRGGRFLERIAFSDLHGEDHNDNKKV